MSEKKNETEYKTIKDLENSLNDTLEDISKIEQVRKNKLEKLPINYDFEPTISLRNVNVANIGSEKKIAGRIIFKRIINKIAFLKLRDSESTFQISLFADSLGEEKYNLWLNCLDIGDIIGVSGVLYKTIAGELTLQVNHLQLLSKSLRAWPNKWQGLKNEELKLRYPYIDYLLDDETRAKKQVVQKIINFIRKYLTNKGLEEVETPVLNNFASGAQANPFKTHHDSLNIDMFLRIAPEIKLKMLMIALMKPIFEIATVFRNEGLSSSHLQEFKSLEIYVPYMNYEQGMNFMTEFVQNIVKEITQNLVINGYDFSYIARCEYKELMKKYANLKNWQDEKELREIAEKNKINITDCKSNYAILDLIYKKLCLVNIQQPTIIFNYPPSPLAALCKEDPNFAEQFQLILCGKEIAKNYRELVDSEQLAKNFTEQAEIQRSGETDIVREDTEFIEALEYGAPPMFGLNLGINRFAALLMSIILNKSVSIRDCVFFNNVVTI